MEEEFANANSLHSAGLKARAAVEASRIQVAAALGVEPEEIVFTSGATESNNWVASSFGRVRISPFEHSSLWERLRLGAITWDSDSEADLNCRMLVNNETGTRYDRPDIPGRWHCDMTQAVGKVPIQLGFDFASFSAHKFYGPKGVGALFAKDACFPVPLMHGGEHEGGHRAGTLNVPAIVGMGAAIEIAIANQASDFERATELRPIVLEELRGLSDWQVNGDEKGSPHILSLSFLEVEGELVVLELDREGYAISSGAACSSRSNELSHVLISMGYPPEWVRGTIRVSFGRANTAESASGMAAAIRRAVERLRKLA